VDTINDKRLQVYYEDQDEDSVSSTMLDSNIPDISSENGLFDFRENPSDSPLDPASTTTASISVPHGSVPVSYANIPVPAPQKGVSILLQVYPAVVHTSIMLIPTLLS
jgi:hypothetical protein